SLLREASLHVVPGASVVVPVIIDDLPERIEALGKSWERKVEFHVTVISPAKLPADDSEAWRTVTQVCAGRALGPITARHEVRRVGGHPAKPQLRTLIVMVDVPGFPTLFEDLSAAFGTRMAPPPAHVTVYS